jgi:hypothetical protein
MPIDFENNSWLDPPRERRQFGTLYQDVVRKIQKNKNNKALLNRDLSKTWRRGWDSNPRVQSTMD